MTTKGPLILQLDYRLGGVTRYVFAPEGELMRLPPEVQRCVAFVGCVRKGAFTSKGTAFFIGYPCGPEEKWLYYYLVTARHVIEAIRKLSDDGSIYLRINLRDSGFQVVRVDNFSWVFHQDDLVDVAAAAILWPDGADHMVITTKSFATDEVIEEHKIGAGNQLFFPGLFSRHQGERRNIPIVRMGNIAAMPEDRIVIEDWGKIEAYLVEARSIGGLSGSPVFVYLGPREIGAEWLHRPVPAGIASLQFGTSYLLGLIQGHYGVKDLMDIDADESDNLSNIEKQSVNMGIGIVVPAKHILSLLRDDPTLYAFRNEAVHKKLAEEESSGTELD